MSYLRAEDVLPLEVLFLVQKYVSGETIYILSKERKNGEIIPVQKRFLNVEIKRLSGNTNAVFPLRI
jgi:hypothetical protein